MAALPHLLHTSSLRPMAAVSSLNLKHLSRLLYTNSLRPMAAYSPNLKHLARLRPMTLRATSSCFPTDAERAFYEMFQIEREPEPTSEKPNPAFVHHEFVFQAREDGFNIRLSMLGVNKENVKVWFVCDKLIAEGKMEKYYEDEDDVTIRYTMLCPPSEVFNLDATRAEIKSGILGVFVPKKD